MSNILDYVKQHKNKTLKEFPFNNVDNVILSSISYLDFGSILKNRKLSVEEAGYLFFNKYTKKELNNNLFSVTAAIKIFKAIYKTNRYKNLILYNYIYKTSINKQFSAVFIDIDENITFISFEGTDELVSGWREDAELVYKYPVESQKEAIKYINRNISMFSNRDYLVGGHSKGGNLALVATMNANPIVRSKIKTIYMNDGVGLKEKQLNSKKYKCVKNRIVRIIPDHSIFGLINKHDVDPIVIYSKKKGVMAHNILYWETEGTDFVPAKLSLFSKKLNEKLKNWIETYDDNQRKEVVDDIFQIFARANITNVLAIKKGTINKLISIRQESKRLSPKSKKALDELINLLIALLKEESSNYISSKFSKLKH
ncbi:MAG: DUF2974 domain-containing protein [Erysipelotrichales bacterium]|nr:DUF2974 domain-containing protein [Erysipelotrichales bacterium]